VVLIITLFFAAGLGGLLRYFGQEALAPMGSSWAILLVNGIGSFCIGLLAARGGTGQNSDFWLLVIGVGLLGGFTTFSGFAIDVVRTLVTSGVFWALAYVTLHNFVCVLACFLGYRSH